MNTQKPLSIIDCYKSAILKYVQFNGRSTRKEYWSFIFINFFILIGLELGALASPVVAMISLAYSLFIIFPTVSLTVRRFHDSNKSGWLVLLLHIIPTIAALCLLGMILAPLIIGQISYTISIWVPVCIYLVSTIAFIAILCLPSNVNSNKYDMQKSHPIRNTFLLLVLIVFVVPILVVGVLLLFISLFSGLTLMHLASFVAAQDIEPLPEDDNMIMVEPVQPSDKTMQPTATVDEKGVLTIEQ